MWLEVYCTLLRRQEEEFAERENARLRKVVLEVNAAEAERMNDVLHARGNVSDGVIKLISETKLTATAFHAAIATMKKLGEFKAGAASAAEASAKASASLPGRSGASPPPAARRAVPLMGGKVWDDGDPRLPALRQKYATQPRYFVDREYGGFTALMKVAIEGNSEGVQRLLDAGADPDVETSKGCTALSWAAVMGHRAVVFVLLRAGAILDYPSCTEGLTPLMQSVLNNRVDCVLLLLQVQFERCVPCVPRASTVSGGMVLVDMSRAVNGWSRHERATVTPTRVKHFLTPLARACQANHLRKLELEAREFRTEIERAEFAAVDWVDEYESAIRRKDKSGKTALDHANRHCLFDIAKCVEASLAR